MITENDLIEMLQPIKNYIDNNNVTKDDIPCIVYNHFPSEQKLEEIALFLGDNAPEFKKYTGGKIVDRTRQILRLALEEGATSYYLDTKVTPTTQYSLEEITEELSDYEYDGGYGYHTDENDY